VAVESLFSLSGLSTVETQRKLYQQADEFTASLIPLWPMLFIFSPFIDYFLSLKTSMATKSSI
jgi:hypothetical protein